MVLDLHKQELSPPLPIKAYYQHIPSVTFEMKSQPLQASPLSRDTGASYTGKAAIEVKIFLLFLQATPSTLLGLKDIVKRTSLSTLFSSILFILPTVKKNST